VDDDEVRLAIPQGTAVAHRAEPTGVRVQVEGVGRQGGTVGGESPRAARSRRSFVEASNAAWAVLPNVNVATVTVVGTR
jgi:hypothetical protein